MMVSRQENPGRYLEITADRLYVEPSGAVKAAHRDVADAENLHALEYDVGRAIAECFALEELAAREALADLEDKPVPILGRGFRIVVEAL